MHDVTIKHRNRLRHHYTLTSNVLLFVYKGLSDGAKVTYQVIDSFDWTDANGVRKGYAYPSKQTLASVRGVGEKTIQRHFAELEHFGLLTREARAGRPSLLIIEDPSDEEAEKYLARFGRGGEDKTVQGTQDKTVHSNKQSKSETFKSVNEKKPLRTRGAEPEAIGTILTRFKPEDRRVWKPQKDRQEYLVGEMLSVLGDEHSVGYYRKLAATFPSGVIFEKLSLVKDAVRRGAIKNNRGAFFVSILKDRATRSTSNGN